MTPCTDRCAASFHTESVENETQLATGLHSANVAQRGPLAGRPAISAVVIARNEARTVRRCVRSVLAQTFPVSEIVVVDGHSVDGTRAVVRELAVRNERVRLIEEPQRTGQHGPAFARNTGAAAAREEILLFLNADVEIGPSYVEWLLKFMQTKDLDAAAGLRWNAGRSLVSRLGNIHYALNYNAAAEHHLSDPEFLSGDALLIKRSALSHVGGYDSEFPSGEDVDLGYRLRAAGFRMAYRRDLIIRHDGAHSASLSSWLGQIVWYGRGNAGLMRSHGWRRGRELNGLGRHVAIPVALLALTLSTLTFALVTGGGLTWGVTAALPVSAGARYLLSAARTARACKQAPLPQQPKSSDTWLYPLFRSVRYAVLSSATWYFALRRPGPEAARSAEARLP